MPPIPTTPHSTNRVEQQTLPHLYVSRSPLSVAVVFLILAIFSLPIGVVVIIAGDRTTKLEYRYDNIRNYRNIIGNAGEHAVDFLFNGSTYSTGEKTQFNFSLSRSLAAPIYIQYRLHPFYQNYRWFGASVDRVQLAGGTRDLTVDCNPYRFPGEANGEDISGYYSPCGAYPWSLFNDSINLFKADGTLICNGSAFTIEGANLEPNNHCRKSGIALSKDINSGFKAPGEIPGHGTIWKSGGDPSATDPYQQRGYYYREPGHNIPSTRDEDLMVWLNMAYMPDVVNTYRIIETDLPAGDYYFDITEQYPTVGYSSQKMVQLTTRSWIGERNLALGIMLIVLGSTAFITATSLLLLHCFITPQHRK